MATRLATIFGLILLPLSYIVAQKEMDERGEDIERIERVWNHRMSPEAYMNAMRATGMLNAVERNATHIEGGGWYSIGPSGEVQPYGYNGRIAGIQIYNTGATNYVYAGGSSGGLWRSQISTGFHVWQSLGEGLPNPSVRAFAVHPTNPDEILVGTGDEARYGGAGMFRTTNGGSTWSEIPIVGPPKSFFRVQFVPGSPNIVLAASSIALFRSTDGGTTWAVAVTGYASDLVIDPSDPNIQYATVSSASARGVYKSTDRGASWTRKALPVGTFGRASLAICRNTPSTLACMIESNRFLQAVLKSTNAGESWTNITSNILGLFGFDSDQLQHAQAIAIRPNNPDDIFVGGVKLARSTNGGANWSIMADNVFLHNDIAQLQFSDITGTDVLWIGTDGGLVRFPIGSVGENWNGTGLNGLRCSQIDYMDAQRTLIALGLQDNGIFRSTTSGGLWENTVVDDGFYCEITDDLGFEYWHADGPSSLPPAFRVSRQRLVGEPEWTNNTESQAVLFFNRYSSKMYSIAGNALKATTTAGTPSWSTDANLPALGPGRIFGSALDGQTLYITNGAGPIVTICRRNGTTWDTTKFNFGIGTIVSAVYASTEVSGEAWAGLWYESGFGPTIFHTNDYGQTWQNISGSVLNMVNEVRAIVTKPLNPREIYVGTTIGVFRTTDGGTTWTPFQEGLPAVLVTGLKYIINPNHTGTDRILVSTYGRGMYERTILTSPIVYTDLNASGFEDGTFEHPYNTMGEGITIVPTNGMLGLRGGQTFTVTVSLSRPMTIKSYGGIAIINR